MLRSNTVPQAVGEWKTKQIAYRQASRTLILGQIDQAFTVSGPELVIRRIACTLLPTVECVAGGGRCGHPRYRAHRHRGLGWKPTVSTILI
jgi:hypothetical protein